jgi:hypothetical protein
MSNQPYPPYSLIYCSRILIPHDAICERPSKSILECCILDAIEASDSPQPSFWIVRVKREGSNSSIRAREVDPWLREMEDFDRF